MILELVGLVDRLVKELPESTNTSYLVVMNTEKQGRMMFQYLRQMLSSKRSCRDMLRRTHTNPIGYLELANGSSVRIVVSDRHMLGLYADKIFLFEPDRMNENLLDAAMMVRVNSKESTIEEIG